MIDLFHLFPLLLCHVLAQCNWFIIGLFIVAIGRGWPVAPTQFNSIDKSSPLFRLPPITLNVTKTNSAPVLVGRGIYSSFFHTDCCLSCATQVIFYLSVCTSAFFHFFCLHFSMFFVECRFVWRFNLIWLVRICDFLRFTWMQNEYSWLIDLCEVARVWLADWFVDSARLNRVWINVGAICGQVWLVCTSTMNSAISHIRLCQFNSNWYIIAANGWIY